MHLQFSSCVMLCHVVYVCVVLCWYGCSSCVMRGNCMSCHLCGSFCYVMSCLLVFKGYIGVHDMFCYICKCVGCVMEDHIMLCHLFMLMLKQNYESSCYSMLSYEKRCLSFVITMLLCSILGMALLILIIITDLNFDKIIKWIHKRKEQNWWWRGRRKERDRKQRKKCWGGEERMRLWRGERRDRRKRKVEEREAKRGVEGLGGGREELKGRDL